MRAPNGPNWIDIVRWRSIGDAEHAARSAMKDPELMMAPCSANYFVGFIQKSSVKAVRMEHTRLYH
jgi:hypothetical protein